MAYPETFFVTGASGSQGRAVARKLLSAGHKPSSLAIQKLGATLIKGDYDDIAALEEAAEGCTGVFILSMGTQPASLEIEQAQNIIDASIAAGVKKAVCSTVTRAEEAEKFIGLVPGNPHFAAYWPTKKAVQDAVQTAGFETWTILQPAWLMTNWIAPVGPFFFSELKKDKLLDVALREDTIIYITAPDDMGSFALKAFEGGLSGEIIRVASDGLTIGECASVVSEVSGVKVGWRIKTEEEVEKQKDINPLVASQIWARDEGPKVDLEKVRGYGIPLTGFREFLESHKEGLLEAID
ncbi:NmrA-like family domain-containing protein [Lachnellula suecica]|uniref:NmrA-like family domain-containing protein n=1 Tax=Lachnellula suecica TaxID=602035 RepID=A0A8T9CAS7_9HELO|nr:NmrA-like family domain-containing protein [Lachnellula suecica]